MATIGPVELDIRIEDNTAVVSVQYEIGFDSYDQHSNQRYVEVCRLVGDDTATGDPPAEGPDDPLGFLTPMFFVHTQSNGKRSIRRRFTKTFHRADLNEDRGMVPNPDEIRALVTLTPVSPSEARRESNMVKLEIT